MNEKGYAIDGKKQAIDILQRLTSKEKETILNNIGLKNAVMAKELSEQSFNYRDIQRLGDNDIKKLFNLSNPSIIGLALYDCDKSFQRRVLNLLDRTKAENAFKVMNRDLSSHYSECQRAQSKILGHAIELSRRSLIELN